MNDITAKDDTDFFMGLHQNLIDSCNERWKDPLEATRKYYFLIMKLMEFFSSDQPELYKATIEKIEERVL